MGNWLFWIIETKQQKHDKMKNYTTEQMQQINADFLLWIMSDDVHEFPNGTYATQDAQWKNRIPDLDALKAYFIREFVG